LNGESVLVNAWGGHEITVNSVLREGDPGIYEGFPSEFFQVTADVPEVFAITPFNFANVSGSCPGLDTFGIFCYDTKGWPITAVPPLGQSHILSPGASWAQSITVHPPATATGSDTDTVIVAMTYCDSTGYVPPVFDDCEDPNVYLGGDYYSTDTIILVLEPGSGMDDIPHADFLNQNFPNPFNPTTVISYGIKHPSYVSLRIYDVNGRLVRALIDARRAAGYHAETWDGKNERGVAVGSGVYFYRLIAGEFVDTKKLILLR
jgi:hypothetical protein